MEYSYHESRTKLLVVLDCETFSKYHFLNRHFVDHDNEKDVEMATWSVICLVESENTYQTAAPECIWLPDRYSEVCVKILMDKIKNFNVNMDVLSYMKRMKDDDSNTNRAWQSEMVFFGSDYDKNDETMPIFIWTIGINVSWVEIFFVSGITYFLTTKKWLFWTVNFKKVLKSKRESCF